MKKGITTIGAMKSRSIFAILGLAAFSVAFGVPESKARPISLIYQVDTPAIKVEAGVQVGSNIKIYSEQFSYENIFAITQIGDNNVADVSQIGATNVAKVYQYGSHGSEFGFQYGYHNSNTQVQIGNSISILLIAP